MLTSKEIYAQIQKLTAELIETGLCDDQNFPSMIKRGCDIEEIGITAADNSLFLKSISYSEMYCELVRKKIYNVKLIDGALLYMLYRFENDQLLAHRLSYFPAPDLESFQNEPELYLEDEIYIDILDKRIVTVPIRFDFDRSEGTYKPVEHPISHLTLGQYEHCRIPVSTAVTPYQFVTFIIRNFYHTVQSKYGEKLTVFKEKFESSIFDEEFELMHICTPNCK